MAATKLDDMKYIEYHGQDDKGFEQIGNGFRILIGVWTREYVHVFSPSRLVHLRTTDERLKAVKAKLIDLTPGKAKSILLAMESNMSGKKRNNIWDGGRWGQWFLAKLAGVEPGEEPPADERPDKPIATIEAFSSPEAGALHDAETSGQTAVVEEAAQERKRRKAKPAVEATPQEQPTAAEEMTDVAKKAKKANGTKKAPKEKKPLGKIKLIKANWATDKNPRREGTNAAGRCADMLKYIAKHPSADASEVITNTSYRGDDLKYDIAHKFIELK